MLDTFLVREPSAAKLCVYIRFVHFSLILLTFSLSLSSFLRERENKRFSFTIRRGITEIKKVINFYFLVQIMYYITVYCYTYKFSLSRSIKIYNIFNAGLKRIFAKIVFLASILSKVKLLKWHINGKNYAALIYSEIKGVLKFYALPR